MASKKSSKQRAARRRQHRPHPRRAADPVGEPIGERQRDPAQLQVLLWQLDAATGPERAGLLSQLDHYGDLAVTTIARQIRDRCQSLHGEGWAPTDLLHVVGREQSALHVGLAAFCIGQGQGVAALAGRDGGWAGELRACVDVAIPPTVATLGPAVELLSALRRFPPTITGRPLPGEGTTDPRIADGLDDQILAKVRALLAKAESTDFEAEAEALTAKAQQLITRHAIDSANLDGDDRTIHPTTVRRLLLHNPYVRPKAMLVGEVADANRCFAVTSPAFGFCTVYGTTEDLDATELLVTSLLAQAVKSMTLLGGRSDAVGRSRTRSFRHAFLQGFAFRIGDRLHQAGEDTIQAIGDDRALPVLASRELAAKEAAHEASPNLQRSTTRASNSAGLAAGQAAADLASLDISSGALTRAAAS